MLHMDDLSIFDHFPITAMNCKIRLDKVTVNIMFDINTFILWDKLNPHELNTNKNNLNELLNDFDYCNFTTFCCYDQFCRNPTHILEIEKIYTKLLLILEKSSKPLQQNRNVYNFRPVPGWNDHIKQHYNTAKHNFLAWKDGGKPVCGQLLNEMKESRKKFRQVFNHCKNNENKIRNEKMVQSLNSKSTKEFWQCVRNCKGYANGATLIKIDNEVDSHKIANIFSLKYKQIFDDKKCQINEDDENYVKCDTQVKELRYFNTQLIQDAIKTLKYTIGPDNIHSNHLCHGTQLLYSFLSKLYSICYKHS
jgi:hypothetical protein